MTDLEKLREWIKTYPGHSGIADFCVDFADNVPGVGSIAPSGLVEIGRITDIFGSVTVQNQYNFALYYVFQKAPGDDEGSTTNAEWVMDTKP